MPNDGIKDWKLALLKNDMCLQLTARSNFSNMMGEIRSAQN